MGENPTEMNVKDLFKAMSKTGQKLLVSMAHPSYLGIKKDGMLAMSAMEAQELDQALAELESLGLIQTGKATGNPRHPEFTIGEGERFRLVPEAKTQVFKNILKIKPPEELIRPKL